MIFLSIKMMKPRQGSQVGIRRATLNDLVSITELVKLYRTFYQYSANDTQAIERFIKERFRLDETIIFLAIVEGETVGFVQLYANFSTVSLGKVWNLNDLYVMSLHRGQGIGKSLVQAALDFAKQDGAVRVDIKTQDHNATAEALYGQLGFIQDEVFTHYAYSLK